MSVEETTQKLHVENPMNSATVTTYDVTEIVRDTLATSELGRARHAVKALATAANTNTRSAENWLQGRCAPNVASFINLCRRIPEMKAAALRLLEADDVLDPELAVRLDAAMTAWAAYNNRNRENA